ncbi:MAG: hypothetical protein Q8P59_14065 [Dehalococcoidia bacterium]|nr:hypothetical protein [Dehalococcoidia bacterium]
MIHKEAWHKEAGGSFDRELRTHLETGHRGLISGDEFMARMLRMYGYKGDTSNLLRNDGKSLYITHAWLQAHREKIDALNQVIKGLVNLLRTHQENYDFVDYVFDNYEWDIAPGDEERFDLLIQIEETYREGERALCVGGGYLWWTGPLAETEGQLLGGLQGVTNHLQRIYEDLQRVVAGGSEG